LIDSAPVIRRVVDDVKRHRNRATISARFHNAVAKMIAEVCGRIRETHGLQMVALSGGVFQNMTVLGKTVDLLEGAGFEVLTPRRVPPNDGGISLGQAAIAAQLAGDRL
jgi:hydrogenase maturation protein HypF